MSHEKRRVDPDAREGRELTRRDFLKFTGVVVAGAGAGVGIASCDGGAQPCDLVAVPVSEGYLLVDTAKCQGCVSCMMACSLVHEGKVSLSLSRIQILQNSFKAWPGDLSIEQCRQCVDPPCLQACPRCALFADESAGNVRRVDRDRCIGCGKCVRACPYTPSRPLLAEDEMYDDEMKSRKCDLCADAPYLCDRQGNPMAGGPGGMQACVSICPVGAISFTSDVPEQEEDRGYKVNLRDENWEGLGYPADEIETS